MVSPILNFMYLKDRARGEEEEKEEEERGGGEGGEEERAGEGRGGEGRGEIQKNINLPSAGSFHK